MGCPCGKSLAEPNLDRLISKFFMSLIQKQPTTKNNVMYAVNDAVKVYPLWETDSQPSSTPGSNRRSLPVAIEKRQAYSTMPMPSQVGPPSSAPNPPPTSTASDLESSSTSSAAAATPTTCTLLPQSPFECLLTGNGDSIADAALPLVAGAPPCIPITSKLDSVIFECAARKQIPKGTIFRPHTPFTRLNTPTHLHSRTTLERTRHRHLGLSRQRLPRSTRRRRFCSAR
jgi:hypothetical protein